MERLSMIAAIGERTHAIGKNNDLLFKISADLERFRSLTRGHPVVMGRKTWESLPSAVRPMPGRTNIVITRDANYEAKGATVVTSLPDALAKAKDAPGSEEVFIIGGGEIYAEGIKDANRLYLTLVDDDTAGDVSFPSYDAFTKEVEREVHADGALKFTYLTLEK